MEKDRFFVVFVGGGRVGDADSYLVAKNYLLAADRMLEGPFDEWEDAACRLDDARIAHEVIES